MRLVFIFATTVTFILTAKISDHPEPGELALVLNENDFEDYLDFWLDMEQRCSIRVNGDLGHPQPVYIHRNNYLTPTGNTGQIHLNTGEEVLIACTGSARTIQHPNVITSVNTGTTVCVNGTLFSGVGWLSGNATFSELICSSHSYHDALFTSDRCFNNNLVIRVGFIVNDVFYPQYWSCFDQNRLEVLYVWYEQNPQNAVHQTGVDRPSWQASSFFPGVYINNRYTQVQQKLAIASYVGDALADKYVTNTQFLARGHLATKTDFIYATGQRATFYFINAAPQWQPFNAGNWNWLEQNLRARIGEAGYNTIIYSGTYGVTQLRNASNQFVEIYLHRDTNNNAQLPVPLYFYKVVYAASQHIRTAFISINNPYYTLAEAQSLQFSTDICRNNTAFKWIGWQPDRVDIGYSFCCTVNDFRRFVPHLPAFTVTGILS